MNGLRRRVAALEASGRPGTPPILFRPYGLSEADRAAWHAREVDPVARQGVRPIVVDLFPGDEDL